MTKTRQEKRRLLFVVNDPSYFISHRIAVALQARNSGFEVHVASPPGPASKTIENNGFEHHPVAIARGGKNPLVELVSIYSIYRIMLRLRPSLVHLVTTKPVLYGGIAARLAKVPAMLAAVSGLGTVFIAQGGRAELLKRVVSVLYRRALGHRNLAVIFQNPDDRQALVDIRAVQQSQARMIRGSGINLVDCPWEPEPTGVPVVTMAARLLRDKGVEEFVEAARLLAERGVEIRFRLIGDRDPGNPTSVTEAQLDEWRNEGLIELLGHRDDVPGQYAQSHIICLPSYREGLPKSLVEAAGCGRAVVTTDVPGCRDAIEPDVTGLLVPARDATVLADAIQLFVEDPEKRQAMGRAGRELAEREFTIARIVDQHLAIYEELEATA